MSGPKLSEYELEQLRKAELERIQREIENLHANILRIKKDIFSETEWCRHELDQMERQINLVNGCSLSEEERSQAHSIIASERQRICDLLRSMDAITSHVITHPNELKEVQAEERHIRDFWSRLIESKAMILTDRIEYESVMANVAEKIKGTLGCSTLSLAEAMYANILGQNSALAKVMDVIKRSVVGRGGVSNNRPKGVLFFAGPTGTGKTETAKALARNIFGDESCCLRFDMAEYKQSHSDQKLLGAPPGYIGYEAGGQLTNAVRDNPFSIILFDEIEKAHPSILDKFLQILDDGRLTDGQGNTVYFSESIIIFTSNKGIVGTVSEVDEFGNRIEKNKQLIDPKNCVTHKEMQAKVIDGIRNYFKYELGRPELPQIINLLVHKVYTSTGWNSKDRIKPNEEREYPTINTMIQLIDEVIDEIRYSSKYPETAENMRGVIRGRLLSIIQGAMNDVLNTTNNISIEEMFSTSAVVELDDFAETNKTFMSGLLALKTYEYSRNSDYGSKTKRLLIIEEAHNIVPNTEQKRVSSNIAMCSNHFTSMLAEVAAYGTGLVIIDQRPTAVSPAVVANTGTKIIHNLQAGEDKTAVGASLGLTETEVNMISDLKVGQAIVKIPNSSEKCRVNINRNLIEANVVNWGVLFLGSNQQRYISPGVAPSERSYFLSCGSSAEAIINCLSFAELRLHRLMDFPEKMLYAGELLNTIKTSVRNKRQILYEVFEVVR